MLESMSNRGSEWMCLWLNSKIFVTIHFDLWYLIMSLTEAALRKG